MSEYSKLLKIINKFKGKEILVVGDIMLDKYTTGNVERISPEGPIPIIELLENIPPEYRLGGAANVANNISSLEGKVHLCGVVGDDANGDLLIDLLNRYNIDCSGIIKDSNRPTISKERYVAKNHNDRQVVRIDSPKTRDLPKSLEDKFMDCANKIAYKMDVVIFSDYGKGLLTKRFVKSIKDASEEIITIVDTKPDREHYFKGCSWFTPNKEEAEKISKMSYDNIKDKDKLIDIGNVLIKKLKPKKGVILTCGEDGMFLYDLNNSFKHIPTIEKEVSDVSGAGDTVVAAFGLSLAAGAKPIEAALLANHAAGVVVGKAGTATVNIDELRASLNNK